MSAGIGARCGRYQPAHSFSDVVERRRGCRTRSRKILEFKHYCTDPPV